MHPFLDGNGRTGRRLMNFELIREGFSPPAIVETADRLACYDALDKACVTRDCEDITRMVAEGVARSLDICLDAVTGHQPEPLPGERAGGDHGGSPRTDAHAEEGADRRGRAARLPAQAARRYRADGSLGHPRLRLRYERLRAAFMPTPGATTPQRAARRG
ncbi:hypothetical protein D8B29_12745 [Verminephrobacter eiseniae]|nr:hypothetical protein [Verminephrobacter eiseniae]MCW5303338.1 hypothetical protein [Verminephrobacter eiseniae]MCW8180438.1 hypothetical protein [Verminephrobacter eiseniae]MCW8188731.1 hypothetical protein [Verminephrobacter eiseniae]